MPVQGCARNKVKARRPLFVGINSIPVVHVAVRESTMRNHTATQPAACRAAGNSGRACKARRFAVDPAIYAGFLHSPPCPMKNCRILRPMNKRSCVNTPVDRSRCSLSHVAINEYQRWRFFGREIRDRVLRRQDREFSTNSAAGHAYKLSRDRS